MSLAIEYKRKISAKKEEGRKIAKIALDEKRELTTEEGVKLQDILSVVSEWEKHRKLAEAVEADDEPDDDDRSVEDDPEPDGGYSDPGMRGKRRSKPFEGQPDLPNMDGKHKYSLLGAIRSISETGKLKGLEGEVSAELAKSRGRAPQERGFLIPWNLSTNKDYIGERMRTLIEQQARARRPGRGQFRTGVDNTTTFAGSIAGILGTELIDLLRNRMVMKAAGARVLTGLYGSTFSLPKLTAASTGYWVAESTAPTASNATMGQVTWTPRTLGAYSDISRKLVLQTSLDVEEIVRDDLAKVMAIEMDRAGLFGSGSGQVPQGIAGYSGVPNTALGTNGGEPTWALVVALETAVATANADLDRLAYVTSPAGRGNLKTQLRVGTTFPKYIWDTDNPDYPLNNYPAFVTNQVPANLTKGSATTCTGLFYGNWESAVYGLWGPMEMVVDPFTLSNTGGLRLVMLQDLDFELRYAGAFAYTADMLST